LYNKIFTKILDSSIWLESDQTRIVWFTFLASMDQDGFCQFAAPANLARRANVDDEAAAIAIRVLESPDPHSSDPDNEGRRIERVNGGWMVLNSSKYRDIVTAAESRNKTRERVAKWRKKRSVTPVTQVGNAKVMESETETEAETKSVKPSAHKPRGPNPNPQMARAAGESRHSRIHQMVMGWYQDWAGAECPWDGSEGAQLANLLKSTPKWLDGQFVTCLENVARSDCIPKGTRPREWLARLPTFLNSPLDKYKNPKGAGNDTANSKNADRDARNLAAALSYGMEPGVQQVHVSPGEAVSDRTDRRAPAWERPDGAG
jgi:hypothetical protein